MSVSDTEKQGGDSCNENIVSAVRDYLATLPKKEGLDQAIDEGAQIAAIIKPLGLPARIVAAVYAYPLFREQLLTINDLENKVLTGISRFIIGLQQLRLRI